MWHIFYLTTSMAICLVLSLCRGIHIDKVLYIYFSFERTTVKRSALSLYKHPPWVHGQGWHCWYSCQRRHCRRRNTQKCKSDIWSQTSSVPDEEMPVMYGSFATFFLIKGRPQQSHVGIPSHHSLQVEKGRKRALISINKSSSFVKYAALLKTQQMSNTLTKTRLISRWHF